MRHENGGREHAAQTPNELGKGQEEEEDETLLLNRHYYRPLNDPLLSHRLSYSYFY
jgi:hypothetical protein